MKGVPSKVQVEQLRKRYPKGTRICVDSMEDDPCPIESGTVGTVEIIDDIGTVHCRFDNGRHLGVVPGVDRFHKIEQLPGEALTEELNMSM